MPVGYGLTCICSSHHGQIHFHGKNATLIEPLSCTLGQFWDAHSGENQFLVDNLPPDMKRFSKEGAMSLEWHLISARVNLFLNKQIIP